MRETFWSNGKYKGGGGEDSKKPNLIERVRISEYDSPKEKERKQLIRDANKLIKLSSDLPTGRIRHNLSDRATPAEKALMYALKKRGVGYAFQSRFKRRHRSYYYPDFCFYDSKVIVEIDGGYHAKSEQRARDRIRDRWFIEQGYITLRLRNNEVLRDPFAVVSRILQLINSVSVINEQGR